MKIGRLHGIITNPLTILAGAIILFLLMKAGVDAHSPLDLSAATFI